MNKNLQQHVDLRAPDGADGNAPQAAWSIPLPGWMRRLRNENGDMRALFGRAALFPVAVIVGLTALIYHSGQLRALAIALAAPLNPGAPANGFDASTADLVSWVVGCAILLWSWFLYLVPPGRPSAASARLPLADVALMHWVLPLLLLAPIFVARVTVWDPIVLLFLLMTAPLNMTLGTLRGWRMWAGYVALAAAIECMLRDWATAGVLCSAVPAALLLERLWQADRRGQSDRWTLFWYTLGAIYCFAAASATSIATILARDLLPFHGGDPLGLEPQGLCFALWWIAPGLLVNLLSRLAPRLRSEWSAGAILVVGPLACLWIGWHPGSVLGLTTLCVVTAIVLAAGSLLRGEAVRPWRQAGGYLALVLVVIGCWSLNPHPVLGGAATTQTEKPPRTSDFDAFYRRWLAQRGETPEGDRGPVLLVAVAGGGIRAAAHATLSLAAVDDYFGGKFGDRTLAVSAVSGGALGVATWLGQRAEHLPPADVAREYAPTARRLAGFYRHDFVSPAVNRLLGHDLPLALTWKQASDRDVVLANAWSAGWNALRAEASAKDGQQTIFERPFASLGNDATLPAVIFNTTSAADGRPALYTSVKADFPDAWLLDTSVPVKNAIADSARFAAVSPIGHPCTPHEAMPPLHSASTPVKCNAGFDPIAVADGGYHDNSGLAGLEPILDELERYPGGLSNVYLVVIRSNPEVGLPLEEGQRFDNGRLASELLAPMHVLENARGARSELYAGRWERRLGADHVVTWDLDFAQQINKMHQVPKTEQDQKQEAASKGPWPFDWLNKRFNDTESMRQLQLAPLGWTLDRQSFRNLDFQSLMLPEVPRNGNCPDLPRQMAVLCKALPAARPLQRREAAR